MGKRPRQKRETVRLIEQLRGTVGLGESDRTPVDTDHPAIQAPCGVLLTRSREVFGRGKSGKTQPALAGGVGPGFSLNSQTTED